MPQPERCPLCSAAKAVGLQVPGYRLWVCVDCWQQAEAGWAKDAEPILFAALAAAVFRQRREHDPVLIGAGKANYGHSEPAAGAEAPAA